MQEAFMPKTRYTTGSGKTLCVWLFRCHSALRVQYSPAISPQQDHTTTPLPSAVPLNPRQKEISAKTGPQHQYRNKRPVRVHHNISTTRTTASVPPKPNHHPPATIRTLLQNDPGPPPFVPCGVETGACTAGRCPPTAPFAFGFPFPFVPAAAAAAVPAEPLLPLAPPPTPPPLARGPPFFPPATSGGGCGRMPSAAADAAAAEAALLWYPAEEAAAAAAAVENGDGGGKDTCDGIPPGAPAPPPPPPWCCSMCAGAPVAGLAPQPPALAVLLGVAAEAGAPEAVVAAGTPADNDDDPGTMFSAASCFRMDKEKSTRKTAAMWCEFEQGAKRRILERVSFRLLEDTRRALTSTGERGGGKGRDTQGVNSIPVAATYDMSKARCDVYVQAAVCR